MSAVLSGQQLSIIATALAFAVLFPGLSYLLNRRWCGGRLDTDPRGIVLLAGLVFVLAMLCEATINPLYEALYDRKLWVYRLFPLHDDNVSALAVVIWTSYGVHLYFLNQSLDRLLAGRSHRTVRKGMIIGAEAPLLWEVSGNGFFLLLTGEYYAYYNPSDLFHLTSLQVVPVYMLCITLGLCVYAGIQRRNPGWRVSLLLYCTGSGFLMLGLA